MLVQVAYFLKKYPEGSNNGKEETAVDNNMEEEQGEQEEEQEEEKVEAGEEKVEKGEKEKVEKGEDEKMVDEMIGDYKSRQEVFRKMRSPQRRPSPPNSA